MHLRPIRLWSGYCGLLNQFFCSKKLLQPFLWCKLAAYTYKQSICFRPVFFWQYFYQFAFCLFRCFCVYPSKQIANFMHMGVYCNGGDSKALFKTRFAVFLPTPGSVINSSRVFGTFPLYLVRMVLASPLRCLALVL